MKCLTPTVPLKDICSNWKQDIVSGPFGSNLKREHFTTEGIPVLKIQNVKPFNIVSRKMDYVSPEKAAQLFRHSFKKGDIVVTKLGAPLGAAAIVENIEHGIIVADLVRIRVSGADVKYICYQINSPISNHHLNSKQEGATRPRVKLGELRELPIYLPPLPEQKRIVEILDEAFEAIDKATANTEKNIKNAKELFENKLSTILQKHQKYAGKLLKDISVDFGRGRSRHRPRKAKHLYGGKYPFIQTGDIRKSKHEIIEYSQTYSELGLAQSKLWPSGTVCITIAANIAETGILTFDACFPDSIIGIVTNSCLMNNHYLEYMLQAYKVLIQSKGKGSAQDNINLRTFEDLLFSIPPMLIQQEIVSSLRSLEFSLRSLRQQQIHKHNLLSDLKQSILQKAFAGELASDFNAVDNALSEAGV